MSDDFGTVNVRIGAGAREIEVLRKHYRDHRGVLARLASEAPTEHLAAEYGRLVSDIDASLGKLDEIERGVTEPQLAPPASRSAGPAKQHGDPLRWEMEPGAKPLRGSGYEDESQDFRRGTPVPPSRFVVIVIAAIGILLVVGWLVWRASRDRRPTTTVTETPVVTETAPAGGATPPPVTPAPKAAAAAVTFDPALADFGTIRKGTRAVRQIEVTNTTSQPVQYQVARSQCRCLYYEYKGKLAPKQHETLTVTVDGAKAKAGALQEAVTVTSKSNPSLSGNFQVSATIQ